VYEKPTSTREVGQAAPWAKFIIFGDTIAPVLSPRTTEKGKSISRLIESTLGVSGHDTCSRDGPQNLRELQLQRHVIIHKHRVSENTQSPSPIQRQNQRFESCAYRLPQSAAPVNLGSLTASLKSTLPPEFIKVNKAVAGESK